MFDRFVRFAQLRRALKLKRYEEALRLTEDPLLKDQRKTEALRDEALSGLVARARERRAKGHVSAALDDLRVIERSSVEFDGVATLRRELESDRKAQAVDARTGVELAEQALELVENGELRAATALCEEAARLPEVPERIATVQRLIQGRERTAAEALRRAEDAIRAGQLDQARQDLASARAQARDLDGLVRVEAQLAGKVAASFKSQVKAAAGDLERIQAVTESLQQHVTQLPELADADDIAVLLDRTAELAHRALDTKARKAEDAAALQALVVEARRLPTCLWSRPRLAGWKDAWDALADGQDAEGRGELDVAAERWLVAAGGIEGGAVQRHAKEIEKQQRDVQARLSKCREHAAAGRSAEARAGLFEVLSQWPGHGEARMEIDILDRQAADRQDRLTQVRELVAGGELQAASGMLLGLGEDAEVREMLADVRSRIDLVAKGLSQVRRALHGQATGSRKGLEHCVGRLQELQKLQSDHDELNRLTTQLQAEHQGLLLLEAMPADLAAGQRVRFGEKLAEFSSLRGDFVSVSRLDARLLTVLDELLVKMETALQAGRVNEVCEWRSVLTALPADERLPAACESRLESMNERIDAAKAEVATRIPLAREAIARGSIDEARTMLADLRTVWVDCPEAVTLESDLERVSGEHRTLQEVQQLTREKEYVAAHRKLQEMPPTPSYLRTRIFDIKQGIAKAQGLGQAFLLRVDEGGEFLVVRHDSLTIGNVREGKADLPVLARIAGRHARFERSMSFHGGMDDRISALKGDVAVNGKKVERASLKDGDRIVLGGALELAYALPSKRSLSARLQIRGGFQVAGTDKILLLKDRGRDGRILIGRSPDSHVRVPHDGEVELYAAANGEIRVRCVGKGKVGDQAFSGEHPVVAGARVECGDVSMVLLPWEPGC